MSNNPLLQSVIAREPKTLNNLQPNEFRVVFHRIPNMVYFCQSANLTGISLNEFVLPTPFATPVRRAAGGLTYDNFDINFTVAEDLSNWKEIQEWITRIPPTANFMSGYEKYKDNFSDATLIVMNSMSKPIFAIHFKDCFPTALGSLNFETTVGDINPIICNISFAFTGYSVETLTSA